MPESRREMFTRLMRDAATTARPLLGNRIAEVERAFGAEQQVAGPRRASAVANPVSHQRVADLARELDLPVAEEALAALTHVSLTLTLAAARPGRPSTAGQHERTLLALALDEPLLEGSDLPPGRGVLRLTTSNNGPWRLLHEDDDGGVAGHVAYPLPGGTAVGLLASRELAFARKWSDEVAELGLDEQGVEAWGLFRERLAAEQGRELLAESDGVISHRWMGLPDERSGSMPLECELRARGLFQRGLAPLAHERHPEVDTACARWRMLLQLSPDPSLGWRWGERGERLYVWMTAEDMRERRFEDAEFVLR